MGLCMVTDYILQWGMVIILFDWNAIIKQEKHKLLKQKIISSVKNFVKCKYYMLSCPHLI